MSQEKETWYAVRRADGKYLVVVKTPLGARLAMWIDNIELATQWPFMTGATLEMGLDLDPALQAERGGWDVVPVQRREAAPKIVQFAIAIPALLLCLLCSSLASAQTAAPIYSPWVNACLAYYPPKGEESQAAAIRSCQAAEPKAHRFDWKPYAAIVAGQGLDLVTTIHDNPSHPCYETNPRLGGRNATTMSVLLPKLAIIGGTAALLRFAETRDSKAARWIAKSVAYAGGIVGAKDGLGNLRTCGW